MAPKHSRRTLLRYGLGTAAAAIVPAIPVEAESGPIFDCFLHAYGTDADGERRSVCIVIRDGQASISHGSPDGFVPMPPRIGNALRLVLEHPDVWAATE
jgi:hypothetical protein